MKKLTRILLFLLIFTLLLSCISCEFVMTDGQDPKQSGDTQEDTPEPAKPTSKKLELFSSDYTAKFRFVISNKCGPDVSKEVGKLVTKLRKLGADVDDAVLDTDADAVTDCEILIGANIKNRSEKFSIGNDDLAANDFVIQVIEDRVLIVGGSDSALLAALEEFSISGFGVDEDSEEIGKTSIKRTYSQSYRQIESVSIGEQDLSDYAIVYSDSDPNTKALLGRMAKKMQTALHDICGISLDIVPASSGENPDKVFRISYGNAGATGFRVYVSGDELRMECQYENTFERSVDQFIEEDMTEWHGDVVLDSQTTYTHPANELYYSEFGASGDGLVDDFDAICKTHEAANLTGQTVVADGELYYIGVINRTCTIRTNVDWKDAKFTIDDSIVDHAHRNYWIFTVKSDYASRIYKASELEGLKLKKGDTKIDMTFDAPMMLVPVYTGHKVYVRYGINENDGTDCTETLLVDKDGNIDPSTPVLWNYERLDALKTYRLDDTPITISGGIFTTVANRHEREYAYYQRGICVERPNTTVEGVTHYIRGETDTGAPYSAFFTVNNANHVLIRNCMVTGHKTYQLLTNASNSMGSYDLQSGTSNDITWDGITQANSITDHTFWGVHASNFCKNLTLKNSVISRFDAHQGMWNATVINSTLGQYLNCIGGGLLYCENVTRICGEEFISLRSDYGSTWEGDMVIINCRHEGYALQKQAKPDTKAAQIKLMTIHMREWDFGYQCYMPQNLTVDGFDCDLNLTLFFVGAYDCPHQRSHVLAKSISYRNINCRGKWNITNNEMAVPTGEISLIDLSKK